MNKNCFKESLFNTTWQIAKVKFYMFCLLFFFIIFIIYSFSTSSIRYAPKENISNEKTEILKLELSKGFEENKKWIVVTTINQPTDQIKKLSTIKGFNLLVIGDLKTKTPWEAENALFLDVDTQKRISFRSFKSTPFNSYNRKNLGYLFAIQHGAEYIYDTDDDNAPIVDLSSYFSFEPYEYGMMYDCNVSRVINPYAHFGQPLIWPRGFPLSEINKNYYNGYMCGRRKTSLIQQGVVNGDPDVDAIFRLTKSMQYKRINLTFDERSPSIQIPLYHMTPFNSQNTLFHYEAFWALYLPNTVSFRLTDIWRSYWAQRLMWLINGTVSFNGPNAFQLRNSHSYLKDFEEEKAMYSQTESLVQFLLEWQCSLVKFYDCVIDLSEKMAQKGFWQIEEVESIKNWLQDLDKIGYIEPKILNRGNEMHKCSYKFNQDYTPVRYTPKFQKSIDMDNYCCEGKPMDIYDRFESFKYLENFCFFSNAQLNFSGLKNLEFKRPYRKYDLLVTFNHEPRIQNIILIKHLYGYNFKNIIFCGKNILNILNENRGKFKMFDSYTFIDVDVVNGFFHYYCLTKVLEMNLNTEGFLLISDDVLVKYWNLDKYLDYKNMWYETKIKLTMELDPNLTWNCMWWPTHMGRSALTKFVDFYDQVMNGSIQVEKDKYEILKSFMKSAEAHQNSTGKYRKVIKQASDFFYVPKSKFKAFHYLSNIFRKFEVFLEYAVPFLLAGLDSDMTLQGVNSTYYWGVGFYFENYQNLGDFIHPAKISSYLNSTLGSRLCTLFIQEKLVEDVKEF